MVQIIESHLESKTGNLDGGEDRLIVGNRFYGVADGATDKSGNDWGNGRKGGDVLATIVKNVLEAPGNAILSLEALVSRINDEIQNAAERAGIDLSNPINRADCGFAVYDSLENQIVYIHDCNFGFIMEDRSFQEVYMDKAIDRATSQLRADKIRELQAQGIDPFANGKDLGREYIMPILKDQQRLQNPQEGEFDPNEPFHTDLLGPDSTVGKYAYKTMNGFPVELDTYAVPQGTVAIVIATDGYRTLAPTVAEMEGTLKEQLANDPYCINELQSTKGLNENQVSYDDRGVIIIKL